MKKTATALRFLPQQDSAPRLVASGEGWLADEIERIARAKGVPIVRDAGLASALNALDLGDEIPENLYTAVSVLFRFLLERDSQKNSRKENG